MFDVGFPELVLVAIVGLLILGPERLPEALRTLGLWLGRLRRSFSKVKAEIEKEIGMDEIKRQLHNEAVMDEMKRLEREVKGESILDPSLPKAGQEKEQTQHNDAATPEPEMEFTESVPESVSNTKATATLETESFSELGKKSNNDVV